MSFILYAGIYELSREARILGNYLSSNSERVAGYEKYIARNLEVSDLKRAEEEGDQEHESKSSDRKIKN